MLLGLLVAGLQPFRAHAQAEPTAAIAPQQPTALHLRRQSPEDRAQRLAKLLDLDKRQQTELRAVLQSQAEQVRKLWSEQSVPEAYRANEMRAIFARTEERIRALLSVEQRKLYIQKQQPENPVAPQEASFDDWLKASDPGTSSGERKPAQPGIAPEHPQ